MKTTWLRRFLHALAWIVPLALLLLASLSGNLMSQVEQPRYTVLESHGNIEVREYAPTIAAEVEVSGDRMQALHQGFSLIADYIFGDNLSAKKVPMTAPVTQAPGEKIAMTAPVTQLGSGGSWTVRFIMPSAYTLDTLPKPRNGAVHLVTVPARKVVVIRFSGSNTDANIGSHRDTLLQYVADHHLLAAGSPTTAFYNPPWTLPFLRRNEIMIELR
jgi:hypothetical protein